MANKEDEGFYHSLSRKELQTLCKKYGLPANRSSSDMAKSLASYLEDGYGGGSIFFQQTPQSQLVTQYDDSGFKNKEFSTICFDRNCFSFTSDGRLTDMPQIEQKDTNAGACSNETAFPSSINTPSVSPSSFQFHVTSEEGINLYVDLNSNPSVWVEKLKSEVSICQSMSHSKSQTFHKELGCFGESSKQMKSSFQLNVDAGKQKDHQINCGLPSSSIIKENNPLRLDHPDGDDGSLGSTVMTPCARAVDVSEHLEGVQALTLFKVHPDSQEQIIPAGPFSAKDGGLITLDSNIDSPRKKLASNAVLNKSNGPLNLLMTEHQNSKLENDICENSTLQNGCNLVSPGAMFPGCLPGGSLQMPMVHQKDALHPPCENNEFVDLVVPKHNIYTEQGGLGGSTELDQETYRNWRPTLVEEQDRSKIINWGESSEGSQDELFQNCGRLDSVESNGLGKKRAYVDGDQNDCSMLDTKILRSTNHLIRKVLPRRSTRLVSK